MTSAAGIVVVQTRDGVEPEQASQIGKFKVEVAPEPRPNERERGR
jgi:hypothetical protein